MYDNIIFFTYTNSKYKILWDIFFPQLIELCGKDIKQIVLSDKFPQQIKNAKCIEYDDEKCILSEHILQGLNEADADYIFWMQEDNIPYDFFDQKEFERCIQFLEDNKDFDFVKIRKEGTKDFWEHNLDRNNPNNPYCNKSEIKILGLNLYQIDNDDPMLYSHQLIIWRKESFKKIHQHMLSIKDQYINEVVSKSNNKRKSLLMNKEGFINYQCKINNLIKGAYHYDKNKHRSFNNSPTSMQSNILPYLNLIIRGKINNKDHSEVIKKFCLKYNINLNKHF